MAKVNRLRSTENYIPRRATSPSLDCEKPAGECLLELISKMGLVLLQGASGSGKTSASQQEILDLVDEKKLEGDVVYYLDLKEKCHPKDTLEVELAKGMINALATISACVKRLSHEVALEQLGILSEVGLNGVLRMDEIARNMKDHEGKAHPVNLVMVLDNFNPKSLAYISLLRQLVHFKFCIVLSGDLRGNPSIPRMCLAELSQGDWDKFSTTLSNSTETVRSNFMKFGEYFKYRPEYVDFAASECYDGFPTEVELAIETKSPQEVVGILREFGDDSGKIMALLSLFESKRTVNSKILLDLLQKLGLVSSENSSSSGPERRTGENTLDGLKKLKLVYPGQNGELIVTKRLRTSVAFLCQRGLYSADCSAEDISSAMKLKDEDKSLTQEDVVSTFSDGIANWLRSAAWAFAELAWPYWIETPKVKPELPSAAFFDFANSFILLVKLRLNTAQDPEDICLLGCLEALCGRFHYSAFDFSNAVEPLMRATDYLRKGTDYLLKGASAIESAPAALPLDATSISQLSPRMITSIKIFVNLCMRYYIKTLRVLDKMKKSLVEALYLFKITKIFQEVLVVDEKKTKIKDVQFCAVTDYGFNLVQGGAVKEALDLYLGQEYLTLSNLDRTQVVAMMEESVDDLEFFSDYSKISIDKIKCLMRIARCHDFLWQAEADEDGFASQNCIRGWNMMKPIALRIHEDLLEGTLVDKECELLGRKVDSTNRLSEKVGESNFRDLGAILHVCAELYCGLARSLDEIRLLVDMASLAWPLKEAAKSKAHDVAHSRLVYARSLRIGASRLNVNSASAISTMLNKALEEVKLAESAILSRYGRRHEYTVTALAERALILSAMEQSEHQKSAMAIAVDVLDLLEHVGVYPSLKLRIREDMHKIARSFSIQKDSLIDPNQTQGKVSGLPDWVFELVAKTLNPAEDVVALWRHLGLPDDDIQLPNLREKDRKLTKEDLVSILKTSAAKNMDVTSFFGLLGTFGKIQNMCFPMIRYRHFEGAVPGSLELQKKFISVDEQVGPSLNHLARSLCVVRVYREVRGDSSKPKVSNGFVVGDISNDRLLVMTAAHGLIFQDEKPNVTLANQRAENGAVEVKFYGQEEWVPVLGLHTRNGNPLFASFGKDVPDDENLDYVVLSVGTSNSNPSKISINRNVFDENTPSFVLFYNLKYGLICAYDSNDSSTFRKARRYIAEAESGASGCPVFDKDVRLVAWHVHSIGEKRYGVRVEFFPEL